MTGGYPLTIAKIRRTNLKIATIEAEAAEIAQLLSAAYGASDPKVIRAKEVLAAVQRLQWEKPWERDDSFNLEWCRVRRRVTSDSEIKVIRSCRQSRGL